MAMQQANQAGSIGMFLRKIDLLAVLGVLGLFAVVAVPRLKNRGNFAQTECVYNLKQIHLNYVNYLSDHGKFVSQISTNQGGTMELATDLTRVAAHFRPLVSGNTPLHYLVCPVDKLSKAQIPDKLSDANVSYFLSLNPPPEASDWILSGSRNISTASDLGPIQRSSHRTVWDSSIGLHQESGYLLFVDGAVTAVDSIGLNKFFGVGGNISNRVAIPSSR